MSSFDEEETIEGNGIGEPVFIDNENNKFFSSYQTSDLIIHLGECVRIKLEEDPADHCQESFAFGQVLAIYESSLEELVIEVRWFCQAHEVTPAHRKIIMPQSNELVESDSLDDIAAGSVVEVIDIKGVNQSKRLTAGSFYICRFLESASTSSLQKVSPHSMFRRGLSYSHYGYAYVEHLDSIGGAGAGGGGGGVGSDQEPDPFSVAIQRLHVSVIPDSLPCRDFERTTVEEYIRGGLLQPLSAHRPVYICGMPGTGKTATVLASINALRKEAEQQRIPEFNFIEINCLRLKSPTDAYTLLWRGLTGVHMPAKSALKRINQHFDGQARRVSASSSASSSSASSATTSAARDQQQQERVTVCLVDELDYLLTRNFDVMYHFYSWPQVAYSRFMLIGIANTMDLPERLSTRLHSRANVGIDRLVFKPYNHEQIKEILEKRLFELDLQAIDGKAREFVARKAATVAGDLRAALKICQRTIEMYRDLVKERERKRSVIAKSTRSNVVSSDGNGNGTGTGTGTGNGNSVGCAVIGAATGGATGSTGVDAVTGSIGFRDIIQIVKDAVDGYKETPFIAITARACQLDKALMVVMGKYRHTTTGGEDYNSTEASLTCDGIWERLSDLMQKIEADRYFQQGTQQQQQQQSSSSSSSSIQLRTPPYAVYTQALARLCRQGIVIQATSWKLHTGPRSVLYSLHPNFSYSDLLAALAEDPFLKYCLS